MSLLTMLNCMHISPWIEIKAKEVVVLNIIPISSGETQEFFNVEPDCLTRTFEFEEWDSIQKVSYKIWENCALIGEPTLPEEIEADLFGQAQKIFQRILENSKTELNILEEQILVLGIIKIAQTIPFATEQESNALWNYIFHQLSFDSEIVDLKHHALYLQVCKLLKKTMNRHNRYFADGGKVYYNAITLHSLTPEWSVKHFFNILYGFYAKNLNYQYVPMDICYSILVKNISQRWTNIDDVNGKSDSAETIDLRVDVISSGLKNLLMYRPNYMAAVCDAIIKNMDTLLKGGNLDECHNRWNRVLQKWFDEKSEYEKTKMLRAKRRTKSENTIVRQDRIQAYYCGTVEDISILIPRIRLPEITQRPIAKLFQCGTLIHTELLNVFGDSVCYTTYPFQYSLSKETQIDWNLPLSFTVRISCGDQCIYDSNQSIYRDYLLFDLNGKEISYRQGMIADMLLFTDLTTSIDVLDEADSFQQISHVGQLYRISAATAQQILVSGVDITSVTQGDTGIKYYFTHKPTSGVIVEKDSEEYIVFSRTTELTIILPTGSASHHFQVIMDSGYHSLSEYHTSDDIYTVPLLRATRYCHSIKIKDFQTGKNLLSYNYIILTDFSYQFDKDIYYNQMCAGKVKMRIGGTNSTQDFELEEGQTKIRCPLWNETCCCILEVPKLSAHISNLNAFTLPKYMWYKDIEGGDFLRLSYPPNLNIIPFLGGTQLRSVDKGHTFEIGNHIQSKSNWENELPLELLVTNKNGLRDEIHFTSIVFEPRFSSDPIAMIGRKITWNPIESYCGDDGAQFYVQLENDESTDPWHYRTELKRYVIENNFPCIDGIYKYQVYQEGTKSLFTRTEDKLLIEGALMIGNPHRSAFRRKQILLTSVHFWSIQTGGDEVASLQKGGGIVSNIEYVGLSSPDGFEVVIPEYQGTLQFITPDGRYICFNENSWSDLYLHINPIHFWIYDEKLIVRTASDDVLMINTKGLQRFNNVRIVNTMQDLNEQEQKIFCSIADAFDYIIEPQI